MIPEKPIGYLVFSLLPDTCCYTAHGQYKTQYEAIAMAYADAAYRYVEECCDEEDDRIKLTPLYTLTECATGAIAFDVEVNGERDNTYYIIPVLDDPIAIREGEEA